MISLYLPERSWLHAIPAGWKLLALALISLAIAPFENLPVMAVLMAGTLALYATLGRPAWRQAGMLRPMWPLLLMLFAFHLWRGDVALGLAMVLRLVAMVMLANAVTMTTRMDAMMDALEPLLRPLALVGIPPRAIALAIAMVIRFVPLLFALWQALGESYRARTGRRGGWRLLAPFCIQTLRMSHHTAEALTARGGVMKGARR
jgi:biotin transport system permease protein